MSDGSMAGQDREVSDSQNGERWDHKGQNTDRDRICRTSIASTAAAETTVRRPASTSVNTSIRFRSRSLIVTSPIQLVSFLTGGTMTFLKSAYTICVHKLHYRPLLEAAFVRAQPLLE